ncbi:adenylate kinase isoenzyme 6 homolog [Anopheles maculipalpis]|uniref:adenylate kinase isoenzyme 6 homolog n=1 Tax=Anopheles maculipalpis TaxID=1496333 RepID=UPI002158BCD6|nr:adenylate kinase isoenzyme 6 homolog [Anopheles maculipalpis]
MMVLPNILVTGTPGTGKSELCQQLVEKLDFQWQNVSEIVSVNKFVEEYDEEFECPVLDEDKLLDYLEPLMKQGGCVVEYHSSDFFPERWFAAVFVMRCSTSLLYDRLQAREYNERKIKSNMECEIFQIPLDEAKDAYRTDIIFELQSDTKQDLDANVERVRDWLEQWKAKHNKA